MDIKGLSDRKLVETLKAGLEANKVISAIIIHGKAKEPINDFIEVPDHPTRHGFLNTALKLKNHFPDKKYQLEMSGKVTHSYELLLPKVLEAAEQGLIDEDIEEIEYEEVSKEDEKKREFPNRFPKKRV